MEKEKVLLEDEPSRLSFDPRYHLRNISPRIKLLALILLIVGIPYHLWNGPTNSIHISSPHDVVDNILHHGHHGSGSRPGNLYPKPKTTQEETINLIQGLYELMEDMGYLKPGLISYPSHEKSTINRTLTAELGLYDNVVDFMDRLPYVKSTGDRQAQLTNWGGAGYQNMFLLSASFADLRDDDTLRRSRDIWCSDQNIDNKLYPKEQPRPDCRPGGDTKRKVLPRDLLSLTVAEHIHHHWYHSTKREIPRTGSLVLDLRRNLMYAVGWGVRPSSTTYWWIKRDAANSRSNFDVAARGEYLADVDVIRNYPSRSATEALQEWIENLRSLKWVPGFHTFNNDTLRAETTYRDLYKAHGWPTNFNKTSFEIARQDWVALERKRFPVGMIVSNLHTAKQSFRYSLKDLEATWTSYEKSKWREDEAKAEEAINSAQRTVAKTRDILDKWKVELAKEDSMLVEESFKLADAGYDLKFALDDSWYAEYRQRGGCDCWMDWFRMMSIENERGHSTCMKC